MADLDKIRQFVQEAIIDLQSSLYWLSYVK